MIQVITATFEDGVLKPNEPLKLPPHSQVRLAVEPLDEDDERVRRQHAWETVELLWRRSTIDSQGERLSRAQLHERR
ncbi:MAG TPA: antitoxin family protein [Gemmataceae bacterium]|nr:antitoxin family protein [Gemmataceae bacterium]